MPQNIRKRIDELNVQINTFYDLSNAEFKAKKAERKAMEAERDKLLADLEVHIQEVNADIESVNEKLLKSYAENSEDSKIWEEQIHTLQEYNLELKGEKAYDQNASKEELEQSLLDQGILSRKYDINEDVFEIGVEREADDPYLNETFNPESSIHFDAEENSFEYSISEEEGADSRANIIADILSDERMILTKDIKEKDLHKHKDTIRQLLVQAFDYSEENANQVGYVIKDLDGKDAIRASLPKPFGFDIIIADGKIEILDNLNEDQMKNLAHLFHILGVKDFKFSHGTQKDNKKFANKFQKIFNENCEDPTKKLGDVPEYEEQLKNQTLKSSAYNNNPIEIARNSSRSWLSKIGKRVNWDAKFTNHCDGSFSFKIYPSEKAMDESGQVTVGKDSVDRKDQAWLLAVTVTPKVIGGKDSFKMTFRPPSGKATDKDHAKELIGFIKDSGKKYVILGPNITDNDKGTFVAACAKKGRVPILKPQKWLFYNIYLKTLKEEGNKIINADRLDYLERLLDVLLTNNNIPLKAELQTAYNDIIAAINDTKKAMENDLVQKVVNGINQRDANGKPDPELILLEGSTPYKQSSIKLILKAIKDADEISDNEKIDLKMKLLEQIKASGSEGNYGVGDMINAIETETIKEAIEERFNEPAEKNLLAASKYDSKKSKEIFKAIKDSDRLGFKKKLELNDLLIEQIKTANHNKYETEINPDNPELTRQMKCIRAYVDIQRMYAEDLGDGIPMKKMIENAVEEGDARKIYLTTIAVAKVLKDYETKLDADDGYNTKFAMDFRTSFNNTMKELEAKNDFDVEINKVKDKTNTQQVNSALTRLTNSAKSVLKTALDSIENNYDVKRVQPDIAVGKLLDSTPAPSGPAPTGSPEIVGSAEVVGEYYDKDKRAALNIRAYKARVKTGELPYNPQETEITLDNSKNKGLKYRGREIG